MAVLGFGGGFRDVRQWYMRIAVLERRVCLVYAKDGNRPLGTGFLVSPDLVLTATHVAEGRGRGEIGARFDYAVLASGEVQQGATYSFKGPPVASSRVEQFDTTLLCLETAVGDQAIGESGPLRGWVDLNEANTEPAARSSIAIFQHAQGGPLKVAMNTDSVIGLDRAGQNLLYRTDTLPGSSGAPCFDIDWRFVAMHRGRSVNEGNHNYGIAFSRIRQWLEETGLWPMVSRPPPKTEIAKSLGALVLPIIGRIGLDPAQKQLLAQGESQRLELKEHPFDGANVAKISSRLLGTIAAFMNSKDGGTIMVGVKNDRTFVGVEQHYKTVNQQRGDWDGFALWLKQVIDSGLEGPALSDFFSVECFAEGNHDICVINVVPAVTPVFVGGDLYVRKDNGNQRYRGHHLLAYVQRRWPPVPQVAAAASGVPPPYSGDAEQQPKLEATWSAE
jgi:V8-like Glu-specific endopeptidase